MKPFLTLQTVEQVLEHLRSFPIVGEETLPLAEALGRRLAEPFAATEDLPGFDRSTVDGFAVAARDVFGAQEGSPALIKVVGESRMGETPDFSLNPGEGARISTGGMLPTGADCAVMVEYSRPGAGAYIELTRSQAPGDNVILRGDDAARGDVLLPAGRRLRPQDIGLLAAFGAAEASVRRRPRVAILSTGDEVVPLTQTPPPGKIRDVNAHSLAALCREAGALPVMAGLVRDDFGELSATLARLARDNDVVAVSGGSSAGMRDHTVEAFGALPGGKVLVHGVALSPGKPLIVAQSESEGHDGTGTRKVCLLGLPGHVASALISARVFLAPLLQHLQGQADPEILPQVAARLTRPVASAPGRRDYLRVRLVPLEAPLDAPEGGIRFAAEPILGASGLVSDMARADGLLVCPESCEGYDAGTVVSVELLR